MLTSLHLAYFLRSSIDIFSPCQIGNSASACSVRQLSSAAPPLLSNLDTRRICDWKCLQEERVHFVSGTGTGNSRAELTTYCQMDIMGTGEWRTTFYPLMGSVISTLSQIRPSVRPSVRPSRPCRKLRGRRTGSFSRSLRSFPPIPIADAGLPYCLSSVRSPP